MKRILLLGAGMSASSLIKYLLDHAEANNWQLRVTDQSLELVQKKINGHSRGVALSFNALIKEERWTEMEQADLVISMLPARFHPEIAADCLALKKHLITPSYVSQEMKEMHASVKEAGLIFMNEIGVDPGIDHMSAMQIIDQIKHKGGVLESFRSYCGGLIAPESDNNPWNYKFTWNPRNVVLAGQGSAARYIDHGQYKFIPYTQVFTRTDSMHVEGFGTFEGYANRDSLSYREIYGIDTIPTMYRGTLRKPGFCNAWNVFVQLGLTDDSFCMPDAEKLTPRDFLNAFLPYHPTMPVEEKMKNFCLEHECDSVDRFAWLGLFDSSEPLGIPNATPAQLLEHILVNKWVLGPNDKDMLVMVHQFEYTLLNKRYLVTSSMVNLGDDQVHTSMSKTVGLPVGICAKMILNNEIDQRGVVVPTKPNVYAPILDELISYGIAFSETEVEI